MQVRILGPLEVLGDDGRTLVPNRRKQRVLLALLVMNANTAVASESIVEALWGDHQPASAASNLQSYVAGLRTLLSDAEPGGGARLESHRGAYLLRLDAGELDAGIFERLIEQGRQALEAGDVALAADRLGRAVGLWRGRVLQDLDLPAVMQPEVTRLEELHLTAVEDHLDARLGAGAAAELPAELEVLVRLHPLRERLWAQLMLALYRSERQSEALAAFRRVTALLNQELGIAPGPALQALNRRILLGDRTLDQVVVTTPPAPPAAGTPHQLLTNVPAFSGRRAELAELDALLPLADPAVARSVVVAAVSGAGGVGKTALAVHWCHRVADRFPDGQLYANLRGWDATGSVVPPGQAVRGFLLAQGVPATRIPADLDAQAALYRSLLAGKRVLVLLDNAVDAGQLRPLLPGSAGCLVVVTSRNRLSGLVAADGAHPVTLGPLTDDESRELLARRLGRSRVAAEPAAIREIADACAGLPLALTVVSARAAGQPDFPLAVFAGQLRDSRTRLDALDTGEAAGDVRRVLSWSYRSLSGEAARALRLLARQPGRDISVPATASLIGAPVRVTRALLAELAGNHLVTEHLPGRYLLHDLLQAYAAEQPEPDADAAVRRLLDHYLHTAHAAMDQLNPAWEQYDPAPAGPGVVVEPLGDHDQALAWFAAEHAVLLDALDHAAATGLDRHAWQLAWALTTFLERRGLWHEYVSACIAGIAATERLGDAGAEAVLRGRLGRIYTLSSWHDEAEAVDQLDRAAAAGERSGDPARLGYVEMYRASLAGRNERWAEGLDHGRRALDFYTAGSHRRGRAAALNSIGWHLIKLGRHPEALGPCTEAIGIQREIGDRHSEAGSWDSLGFAHLMLGDLDEAARCFGHALQLVRDIGDRYYEATALDHLAEAYEAAGRADDARASWQRALDILDELKHDDANRVRDRLRRPSPAAAGRTVG